MEKQKRNIIVALLLALLLVLIYVAYSKCMLGSFSKKGCPNKDTYCGKPPSPTAAAEAAGLAQMGWRQDVSGLGPAKPGCAPLGAPALAEAQALQRVGALGPGEPYYQGAGDLPPPLLPLMPPHAAPAGGLHPPSLDSFAARGIHRGRASYQAISKFGKDVLDSNSAQTPAHTARLDSMREGFGGPAAGGFGWAPDDATAAPPPGAWGDDIADGESCTRDCTDGCVGTNCADLCKDRCSPA